MKKKEIVPYICWSNLFLLGENSDSVPSAIIRSNTHIYFECIKQMRTFYEITRPANAVFHQLEKTPPYNLGEVFCFQL